ncbi:hypothetical protein [Parasitella parasitica]|uniref:Histone deacetylase complex subunit SAP30 Sin3 binding domain-containing protein n=1 Tax=Parasitella parasitica TaxID=35722 RepID=A0A0B7N2Q8_9FUNG|nr:hypothetical protein [Parasitella parasitica]
MDISVLRKYARVHKIKAKPKASKEELAASVSRHFANQTVKELDTITCFLYTAHYKAEKRRIYDNQADEDDTTQQDYYSTPQPFSTTTTSSTRTRSFRHDPLFATFQFRTPDDIFNQFFGGQDPFKLFMNDPFLGGGIGSGDLHASMMHDSFRSSFDHPQSNNVYNINGMSGASRTMSTTTSIVNGHKHTITKITDANGTRIIEDYGDGRQRVTVNGQEEATPSQQAQQPQQPQQHRIIDGRPSYDMPAIVRPYSSVDLNREYGDNHNAGNYDEEDNSRRP